MSVSTEQNELDKVRSELLDDLSGLLTKSDPATGEDKQKVERMEKAAAGIVDKIAKHMRENESAELKELREKLNAFQRQPAGQSTAVSEYPGEPEGFRNAKGKVKSYYEKHGNYFLDLASRTKDSEKALKIGEYHNALIAPERLKAWATTDLQDVDLVVPDIQAALPFLQAQAKVVPLCTELRISGPQVEFPKYTSGLTVEHVAEGDPKPDSEPTFELLVAQAYTIAGLSQIPNGLLEDYPAARGYISQQLGREVGIQIERDVLNGSGTGEPTGLMNNSEITAREAQDEDGDGQILARDLINGVFRCMQDVRVDGLTEPTAIVMHPRAWTDVALSFESNVGYLYGLPGSTDTPPKGEPSYTFLGLPMIQSAYVTTTYGGTTNQAPIIVGNFQDAVVLRRSPFRIDVDTSQGFKDNTTWFRGEERMGFVVTRPTSFKVLTNYIPSA